MKKNSVKKNFLYQVFYELLIIATPLLVSPHVSRVLGAANIGVYSYTYSIAYYFVLFSALGIKNYGSREIAKVRDCPEKLNETFSGLLLLHFIVSALVIAVYYVYAFCFVDPEVRLYSCLMGLYVIASFFDISWLFFGLEQFKITVIRNSIIKIVSVILIFMFVRERSDLWKYILIFVTTNLFSQIYLWAYLKKYVKFKIVSRHNVFKHAPQMIILFIPTIAISLYNYMDKIMVGIISTETQLGLYDNAEKIIFTASQFIGAVGTVMMPKMSDMLEKKDKSRAMKYIDISMQVVMCMSFALAGGIIGISKTFAPIFWGTEFDACSQLLLVLAFVLPFKGFANVLRTQYLIPSRFDKAYTFSVCLGAGINLVSNYFLIPSMQAMGAVIGTIFAEVMVCVVQTIYCNKYLPVQQYLKYCIPYFLISGLMAIVVYVVGIIMSLNIFTLLIQVVIGTLLYCLICYIFFVKTKKDDILCIINPLIKKLPIIKRIIRK